MREANEKIGSERRYRILGCYAILILLVSSCAFFIRTTDTVAAETSGDFDYHLINQGTEVEITKYRGAGGDVEIPAVIDGKPVTAIGDNAFQFSDLIHLTIPDSVTIIGNNSFFYCISLTYLAIPDNVTFIGDWAFCGCSYLSYVSIPDGVTSIGDYAFLRCTCLPSVTIPGSVTSIGEMTFGVCDHLSSVTISNGVTSIGDSAFSFCTALTSVTIPSSVTYIGDYAFSYCASLTSVTIPSGVTSIGNYTFESCISLTSVTIGRGVTTIGEGAFSDCASLTQIHFEGNAPYCGDYWVYDPNDSLTIYFFEGSTGFTTPEWNGVPSVCLPVPAGPLKFELFLVLGVIGMLTIAVIVAMIIVRGGKKI